MILGTTGSGKTSSIFKDEEFGIKGLDPKETFIISASMKSLPLKGWKTIYPKAELPPEKGNYYPTNDGATVAKIIDYLAEKRDDIQNIILDDNQYLMGDYYMNNASKGDNYTVFKKIGAFMASVFRALDKASNNGKFVFVLSHYEVAGVEGHEVILKSKTAGKMVDNYFTPEGKFDLVLFAYAKMNITKKVMERYFVTSADGTYNQARSAHYMFDSVQIPNDLGLVKQKIIEFEQ